MPLAGDSQETNMEPPGWDAASKSSLGGGITKTVWGMVQSLPRIFPISDELRLVISLRNEFSMEEMWSRPERVQQILPLTNSFSADWASSKSSRHDAIVLLSMCFLPSNLHVRT